MIRTHAWTLSKGDGKGLAEPARLVLEEFSFAEIGDEEVLVEPIFGCWEGNMSHALERSPIDICIARNEDKVVLGNAGVVRVLRPGREARNLHEGDFAMVFCNGIPDRYGYPEKIYGYDAPGTIGLLAKRTKIHHRCLIKIPDHTRFSLAQWAGFSLRYVTAWANWRVAYGCWRVQMPEAPMPHVWGWGGGVTFAQLALARLLGCPAVMVASKAERLRLIEKAGVQSLDRRAFPDLEFDEARFETDERYKAAYLESEARFLREVEARTGGNGVDIFADYLGTPVLRATLKSLARQGVITTAGWKEGMRISSFRAIECINRHLHVNTHYARHDEGLAAMKFAEERGWMPPMESAPCAWEQLPRLIEGYNSGALPDYFPIFAVNPAESAKDSERLDSAA